MSDKPLGIDVSKWQGKIDWNVVAASTSPKVVFTGIRASISWGYTDSWFAFNWSEAKRAGIPRSAYHVVHPDEDGEKQIDHFITLLGNDLGELPPTLDIELDNGLTQPQIRDAVLNCLILFENKTGKKPMIYTRTMWADQYITGLGNTPPDWLNNYDWWLALYLRSGEEHPGPVPLPRGVNAERFKIHQSSNRGKPFGVASMTLDYNRWQGDLNSFYRYIGQNPQASLEERVTALEGRVTTLEGQVAKLTAAAQANNGQV